MQWPARDVALLAEYMSKEPAPDDRLEFALAAIQAMYVNSHRKQDAPAHNVKDFMLFLDPWGEQKAEEESKISDLAGEFGIFNQVR
jgi:hypothetical protein